MFLSARNSWQTKDNKRLLLYMLLSSSTLLTSETFWHQKRQWNDFVTGALISSTNSIVIERCYRTNFLVLLSWILLLASDFALKFNGFLNNRREFSSFLNSSFRGSRVQHFTEKMQFLEKFLSNCLKVAFLFLKWH